MCLGLLRWLVNILSDDQNDRKDVKPWNLIDGSPRSPEETAEYRLEICKGCDFFRPKTQTCKKCGCFMKMKTQLEKAYCPLGKW